MKEIQLQLTMPIRRIHWKKTITKKSKGNMILNELWPKNIASHIKLPESLKHPASNDSFYPVNFEDIIYDSFNLKVQRILIQH